MSSKSHMHQCYTTTIYICIEVVGSWFEGSFTVDVSEPKPNKPNTMNLVEKQAQELGLCENFINGQTGLLGNGTIKGVEKG